jgi:hypothetical protein
MDYFTLFFEYLYVDFIENVLRLFFNYINKFYYKEKENIVEIEKPRLFTIDDVNNQFMENEKEKFIQMFSNITIKWNENVDPEFYNIELYKKTIEFENSTFEMKWKKRTLFQNTPRGNIIMYYDVYKKGFAYYCDQQSIPYIVLNTLAMKYVRWFRCRDLFIDDSVDSQCSPSCLIQLEKEEEKKEGVEKKKTHETSGLKEKLKCGPFAKLKKYNNSTQKIEDVSQTTKPKTENIVKNKNRFLYMGKILNYSFIEKIINKPKINSILFGENKSIYSSMFEKEHSLQMNVLNYAEYKKKMKNEK